ncbi:barstar family protein [Paenibacillus sp. NPDC056579]|uniref:barstar family protein n=1 Tax=Paenibacillus sp. NPDC056579 TaxID=3345871 RepID=UPI003684256E
MGHTYWGNNLDSMWGIFTDFLEAPLLIKWENYEIAVENIGSYAEKLLDTFLELAKESRI